MHRREFFGKAFAGTLIAGEGMRAAYGNGLERESSGVMDDGIVIERPQDGKPHTGKVLASIEPHSDDTSLMWAGTVAKLIAEGYTGYLIRTSNDEKCGAGTVGDAVSGNERDSENVAGILGLKKVIYLNYRNHRMDGVSPLELRGRLIFLIRALKIDTVLTYDPWGHYEENPDHYITAQAVEAACWMAGMDKDYPEHFEAGIEPHSVRERYYYARGPQLVNRIVDVSAHIDRKIDASVANKTQGPAGDAGARLKRQLALRNLRLPILGENDETANRNYVRQFLLKDEGETGRKYGMQYAEKFHYIDQRGGKTEIDEYIEKHAVPM